MEFNELAAEGESEAGALHLLHRRPHLPELFEHRLLILRRDAHPGIAHGNLRRLVLPRGANFDSSPFGRELQSVREEVQEHLLDLPLVGPNPAEPPMIALSGVRSSCDMLARNSDLCRLAASSWRPLSSISWKRRALSMATAAWEANVWSISTVCGRIGRPLTLLSPVRSPIVRPRAIIGITMNFFVRIALSAACGAGSRSSRGSGFCSLNTSGTPSRYALYIAPASLSGIPAPAKSCHSASSNPAPASATSPSPSGVTAQI